MSNPIASTPTHRLIPESVIWASAERVVACGPDGSVVGTFATVSEAERALAGSRRRGFGTLVRRPRYARGAA